MTNTTVVLNTTVSLNALALCLLWAGQAGAVQLQAAQLQTSQLQTAQAGAVQLQAVQLQAAQSGAVQLQAVQLGAAKAHASPSVPAGGMAQAVDPAAEALLAKRPELAALVNSRAGQPGYNAQLRWVHADQSFWVSVAPDAAAQAAAPTPAHQIAAQPRSRLRIFALPESTHHGDGLSLRFEDSGLEPVIAIYSSGQVYSPLVVISQRGPNDYVVRGYHLFEGRIINSLLATSVTFPDIILNTASFDGGMRIRVSFMDGPQLRSQLYAFEKDEEKWFLYRTLTPFNDRFFPGDDDMTSF